VVGLVAFARDTCDEEQPGVSIRPLRHDDLAALLARLHQHGHDQEPGHTFGSGGPAPVVAVRVRASVGQPGASAAAEYRRPTGRRTGRLG
jgi:hypothetical protein